MRVRGLIYLHCISTTATVLLCMLALTTSDSSWLQVEILQFVEKDFTVKSGPSGFSSCVKETLRLKIEYDSNQNKFFSSI